MKHRPLNREETKSVKNYLINYLGNNIENFKFENLYVLEDKDKYDIIYANKEVLEILKNFAKNIYGAGISFGNFEIKRSDGNKIDKINKITNNKNKITNKVSKTNNKVNKIIKIKFSISLEGMSLISKDIVKNYIIVNKKGETLFLYGRDIFKSSILEMNGGGKVAVFNKNRELLGIGNYGGGDMIKNIIDKGWYLRKGG